MKAGEILYVVCENNEAAATSKINLSQVRDAQIPAVSRSSRVVSTSAHCVSKGDIHVLIKIELDISHAALTEGIASSSGHDLD